MVPKRKPRLQVELPSPVRETVRRLEAGGGRVWVVGGAVRDGLLGLPIGDWDLATDLEPTDLQGLFPEALELDTHLGACHLPKPDTPGPNTSVVITTLREEADYKDHRHPETVRFVDRPERDTPRRDFTVNAIYADPHSGALLDYCGGVDDLETRVLRSIGEPSQRFREDSLRLLRALRFAARLGFELEPVTASSLKRSTPLLQHLSPQRVFEELDLAFTGPGRGRALRLLVQHGVATEVLPEAAAMAGVPQPAQFHPEGDVLTHTCLVLDWVPAGNPVQSWSAVLHDTGKPATFERAKDRIRFHGHDQLSAQIAEMVLRRLHAPRELREIVVEVCRDHIRFASLPQMNPRKRDRWLRSPHFAEHLAFHRADCLGSHSDLSIHGAATRWLEELPPQPPPPLCSGRDVLALGVGQGPLVGEILRSVQAELDTLVDPDRNAALTILARMAQPHVKDSRLSGR